MAFEESILVRMGLDSTAMERGMKTAGSKIGQLNRALGALGVGFGIGLLIGKFKSIADKANDLLDKSEQLGVSAEWLQKWGIAANRMGSSAEAAEKGLAKLVLQIGEARDGSETAIKKFEKLGIALDNVDGSAKATEKIIGDIADKIKSIDDPTQRARLAFDLFGKSGAQLVQMLSAGSIGLKEFTDQLSALYDQQTLEKLDDVSKKFREMGDNLSYIGTQLGYGLLIKPFEELGKRLGYTLGIIENLRSFGGTPIGGEVAARSQIFKQMNEEMDARRSAMERKLGKLLPESDVKKEEASRKEILRLEREIKETREKGALIGATEAEKEKQLQAQLNELNNRDYAIETYKQRIIEDAVSLEEKRFSLVDAELEKKRNLKAIEEKRNELAAHQVQIQDRQNQLLQDQINAAAALEKAKGERDRFTLGELANLDLNTIDPQRRQFMGFQKNRALAAMRLQASAAAQMKYGRIEAAEQQRRLADDALRGIRVVTEAESNPFAAQERQLAAAEANLEQLKAINKNTVDKAAVYVNPGVNP